MIDDKSGNAVIKTFYLHINMYHCRSYCGKFSSVAFCGQRYGRLLSLNLKPYLEVSVLKLKPVWALRVKFKRKGVMCCVGCCGRAGR